MAIHGVVAQPGMQQDGQQLFYTDKQVLWNASASLCQDFSIRIDGEYDGEHEKTFSLFLALVVMVIEAIYIKYLWQGICLEVRCH